MADLFDQDTPPSPLEENRPLADKCRPKKISDVIGQKKLIGPDGSLFISESRNGKTWRVIFNGNKLDYGQNQLDQMEKLKEKSYLRIPDKELDLLSQK